MYTRPDLSAPPTHTIPDRQAKARRLAAEGRARGTATGAEPWLRHTSGPPGKPNPSATTLNITDLCPPHPTPRLWRKRNGTSTFNLRKRPAQAEPQEAVARRFLAEQERGPRTRQLWHGWLSRANPLGPYEEVQKQSPISRPASPHNATSERRMKRPERQCDKEGRACSETFYCESCKTPGEDIFSP